MKIRNFVWQTLTAMIIIGCSVQTGPSVPTRSLKTSTVLQTTSTDEFLLSRDPTAFPPRTATPIPIPGSTIPTTPIVSHATEVTTMIHEQCLQTLPAIPKGKSVDGRIILLGNLIHPKGENAYKGIYHEVFFYDLKTGKTSPISGEKPMQIVISPDHGKYALVDGSDYLVKVLSADGYLLKIIPKGESPWFIGQWLDSQHLALVIAKGYPTMDQHEIKYPRDVMVVDWTTDQQHFLASDYPDIDRAQGILWEGTGTTEYDPTLTRVVYASLIDADNRGKAGKGYTLWDIPGKKKIAKLVNERFQETPKWSPNGSQFVLPGENGDLYTITREGKVSQLTYLNPVPQSIPLGTRYYPEQYNWSPDGRLLAFWLKSQDAQGSFRETFAVVDIVSGNITDYCISAGFVGESNSPPAPVWSPDGNYLIISANNQKDGNFDTLLIDLAEGSAAKIGENLAPAGWLNLPQK